ncbi:DUF1028 domain-containing protein [Sporichthya polymorpha]|uniref:DUF1028 domain-containing protein n=1 Tax=Sporichthya polymorpha TaxID=35751 RepID=UPI0003772479|nr:DUF1028 domain-containing protein [Sporichthya polymorpha]
MTYSIVAHDAETGQLAVAGQSHFFGVGRLVGWGEAGVGVAATQAFVNVDHGPHGIERMRAGEEPKAALDALLAADELAAYRQVGFVDASGRAAAHTGSSCAPHAGHLVGEGVTVQGNMLASPAVYTDMLDAYLATDGDLAERVMAAMQAAEAAGGDVRGSQSAVLRVYSGNRTDKPWNEVLLDIRVDDHPDPIGELARLLPRHRAFDLVGGVIFAPGLTIGPYEGVSDELLTEKLSGLAAAAELLGADNREPDFWRAVLLARSGRTEEARALFADLFSYRPGLREFLAGIGPLGFLSNVEEYVR